MPSDTPKSSDGSLSPREFAAKLVKLRQAMNGWRQQVGTGRWRCASDIEDKVQQIAVDHYLRQDLPDKLMPWARRVFENLVRRGPNRNEQDCHYEFEEALATPLKDDDAALTWHATYAVWKVEFERILPAILELLTEPEERALAGIREAESMSDAAERAGMSSRDLRSRFRRIVYKAIRVHDEKSR